MSRRIRVLVVDDNPQAVRILCTLVGAMGMAADGVSSAEQALDLLRQDRRYALMIVDSAMPGVRRSVSAMRSSAVRWRSPSSSASTTARVLTVTRPPASRIAS